MWPIIAPIPRSEERLYKGPKPGEPDYEIETTWQIGTRGVTDHFAYFQHLDLGYTFNFPWKPRLLFHYDYVSGDRQPGDSQTDRSIPCSGRGTLNIAAPDSGVHFSDQTSNHQAGG